MFYDKYVAITGTLEKMQRKEAMQIIVDLGGHCEDNVTKKTNYLILGNNDYNPILRGKKSSKLIKAETLIKRFRHVVSENARTINASESLKEGNITLLGQLLTKSHESLENDYEVTGKELDTLVHNFLKQEGCIGSRMTGAGFGGCCIALLKKGNIGTTQKPQLLKSNINKDKQKIVTDFYLQNLNKMIQVLSLL